MLNTSTMEISEYFNVRILLQDNEFPIVWHIVDTASLDDEICGFDECWKSPFWGSKFVIVDSAFVVNEFQQ